MGNGRYPLIRGGTKNVAWDKFGPRLNKSRTEIKTPGGESLATAFCANYLHAAFVRLLLRVLPGGRHITMTKIYKLGKPMPSKHILRFAPAVNSALAVAIALSLVGCQTPGPMFGST